MKTLLLLCLTMSTFSLAQRNRTGWIEPTDQNFTAKVLSSKQNAYDRNKEGVLIMEGRVHEKLKNITAYLKTVKNNPTENNMQLMKFYVGVVDNLELRRTVDFSNTETARDWINYYYEVLTEIQDWGF